MITTLSGTYTKEEYSRIEKTLAKAYTDYWDGKIDYIQLTKAQEDSNLSYAEIKDVQYRTSMKGGF